MNYIWAYLISIPIFVFFDLLWLGFVAKGFYQDKLGYLLGEVNWPAAIIFYLVFLFGVLVFVTMPAIENNNLIKAILMGALFGFVTYATYDLTNQATIKDWPVAVTIIDIIWGTVLGSIVAGATVWIYRILF